MFIERSYFEGSAVIGYPEDQIMYQKFYYIASDRSEGPVTGSLLYLCNRVSASAV